MILNDVSANRTAFNRARMEACRREKEDLLRRMGWNPTPGRENPSAGISGLLCWYYGGEGFRDRDPRMIPLQRVRKFARFYARIKAA